MPGCVLRVQLPIRLVFVCSSVRISRSVNKHKIDYIFMNCNYCFAMASVTTLVFCVLRLSSSSTYVNMCFLIATVSPRLLQLNPSFGPLRGGTLITIHGVIQNYTVPTSVFFGPPVNISTTDFMRWVVTCRIVYTRIRKSLLDNVRYFPVLSLT